MDHPLRTLLIAAAAIAAVALALRALKHWAPATLSEEERAMSLDELRSRFRRWELAGVGIMGLAVLTCWALLVVAAHWRFRAFEDAVIVLAPSLWVWLGPAFFVGELGAMFALDASYERMMGAEYADFVTYQKKAFGYDSKHLKVPFFVFFGSLSAVATVAMLDWYVAVEPDRFSFSQLWRIGGRSYDYEQVTKIELAPQRETRDGPRSGWVLVIHFDDGESWNSDDIPQNTNNRNWQTLIDHIASRSGRSIDEYPVLPASSFSNR